MCCTQHTLQASVDAAGIGEWPPPPPTRCAAFPTTQCWWWCPCPPIVSNDVCVTIQVNLCDVTTSTSSATVAVGPARSCAGNTSVGFLQLATVGMLLKSIVACIIMDGS